jgi:hypothetical protein
LIVAAPPELVLVVVELDPPAAVEAVELLDELELDPHAASPIDAAIATAIALNVFTSSPSL